MFGISIPELLLVFTIALIIFGPDKLPEIAAKLGTWSAKVKKTSDSVRREVYNHVYEPAQEFSNKFDPNKTISTIKHELKEAVELPAREIEAEINKETEEE